MWGTPYYLRIYEGATQRCSEPAGSMCTYSASSSNTTKTFTAKIENNSGTQAVTPQSISTTWSAPSSPASSIQPQSTSSVIASACAKVQSPLFSDSFNVSVPTASGTKQCAISITHSGIDLSDINVDGGAVSYEMQNTGVNTRTIAMSDNPPSSCKDNLVFQTDFTPSGSSAKVYSVAQSKDASHDLSFGYDVSAAGSNCVIKDVTSNSNCASDTSSSGENACKSPAISSNNTVATKKHGIQRKYSSAAKTGYGGIHSDFNFNFVECTADSQCTPGNANANPDADANKTYCNYGTTHNAGVTAHDTSNFLPNTCIDSVAPTSTMDETTVASGKRCDQNCNTTTPVYSYWFGKGATNTAVTYDISVTDSDGAGSGIDTNSCWYYIQDLGRPTDATNPKSGFRTCSSTIPVTVGPAGSGATCQTQGQDAVGKGYCRIYSLVQDLAGNLGVSSFHNLNIDYTPPTAQ